MLAIVVIVLAGMLWFDGPLFSRLSTGPHFSSIYFLPDGYAFSATTVNAELAALEAKGMLPRSSGWSPEPFSESLTVQRLAIRSDLDARAISTLSVHYRPPRSVGVFVGWYRDFVSPLAYQQMNRLTHEQARLALVDFFEAQIGRDEWTRDPSIGDGVLRGYHGALSSGGGTFRVIDWYGFVQEIAVFLVLIWAVAYLTMALFTLFGGAKQRNRLDAGLCPACGYDRTGLDDFVICSECAEPSPKRGPAP